MFVTLRCVAAVEPWYWHMCGLVNRLHHCALIVSCDTYHLYDGAASDGIWGNEVVGLFFRFLGRGCGIQWNLVGVLLLPGLGDRQ